MKWGYATALPALLAISALHSSTAWFENDSGSHKSRGQNAVTISNVVDVTSPATLSERISIFHEAAEHRVLEGDIHRVFQTEYGAMQKGNYAKASHADGVEKAPDDREADVYPEIPSLEKKPYIVDRIDRLTRSATISQQGSDKSPPADSDAVVSKGEQAAKATNEKHSSYNTESTRQFNNGYADTSDAGIRNEYNKHQSHTHDYGKKVASPTKSLDNAAILQGEGATSSASYNRTKLITTSHQPVSINIPTVYRKVYTAPIELKAHGPQHLETHAQTIFDTMKPVMTGYWKAQIGSVLQAYSLRLQYSSDDVLDGVPKSVNDDRVVTNFNVFVTLEVESNSMHTLTHPNHASSTEDLALFFRGQSLLELLTSLREAGVAINELVYTHEDFQAPPATYDSAAPTASPTVTPPTGVSQVNKGGNDEGPTPAGEGGTKKKSRLGLMAGIGAGCLAVGAVALAFTKSGSNRVRLLRERLGESFSLSAGDEDESQEDSLDHHPHADVMTTTSSAFDMQQNSNLLVNDPRVAATYNKYPSLGIRPAAIQKRPAFSKDYLKSGLEAPAIHSPGGHSKSSGNSSNVNGSINSDMYTITTAQFGASPKADRGEVDTITNSPVSQFSSFRQLRAAEEDEFTMPENYDSSVVTDAVSPQRSMHTITEETDGGINGGVHVTSSGQRLASMRRATTARSGRSMLLEQGLATPSSSDSSNGRATLVASPAAVNAIGSSAYSPASSPSGSSSSSSSYPSPPGAEPYSPFGGSRSQQQQQQHRRQPQRAYVRKSSSYDDSPQSSNSYSTYRPNGVPITQSMMTTSPNTTYSITNTRVGSSTPQSVRMMDGPDMVAYDNSDDFYDEWSLAGISMMSNSPHRRHQQRKNHQDSDYHDASPAADLDMPPLV